MKQVFHAKAFLSRKRNVRLGLVARTRVLQVLEKQNSDIQGVANLSGLKYNVIIHHLHLLEAEHVVGRRSGRRPYVWGLTGAGQQRLDNAKEK